MTRDPALTAALTVLIILQVLMLSALFAGIPPHPPEKTPLFGIGPFIGMAVSTAAAALIIRPDQSKAGRALTVFAAAAALVSFGPQKYLDAQFHLIWPAVLTAQVAIVTIFSKILAPLFASRRLA